MAGAPKVTGLPVAAMLLACERVGAIETGLLARITNMLRMGFPPESAATQLKVIERSPFRATAAFVAGGGGVAGGIIPGPSIINVSYVAVPVVAARISW